MPEEAYRSTTSDLNTFMPRELIKEFRAFIFEQNKKTVKIAAVNPDDPSLQAFVSKRFKNIEWYQATEEDVMAALRSIPQETQNILEDVANLIESHKDAADGTLSKIADKLISYAFARNASDIHIEPTRTETIVRFRVDGALHQITALPRKMHQPLIARFKILANMKIDEYRRPQDGRIEPEEYPETSIRISIMPTLFGEKIALRILNNTTQSLSLEDLGFSEKEQRTLMENFQKPHGLIVTSGPTGSGKTTTLYSILLTANKDGLNISTLEDPVEYTLPSVNQIQINPMVGLDFASGLRALLRQDPDIMMVGEIRDSETALMAANAAMTGHLVLTTIHTNDAASVFTRFLEMSVEDFAVASTINLVIAQRLVRKVCSHCASMQPLDPIILEKIEERKDLVHALEKITKGSLSKLKGQKFARGTGCDSCLGSGYSGRVGIFEFLVPTKKIRDIVLANASTDDIRTAAEKENFKSMITDGIEKVFSGMTTFEEIIRTTKSLQ